MRSRTGSHLVSVVIAAGAMTALLAGCSSSSMPWNRSSGGNFPPPGAAMANGKPTGPPPKVEDCVLIKQSPGTYVCNGKTYTAFQLTRMRTDYEKQMQSGQ